MARFAARRTRRAPGVDVGTHRLIRVEVDAPFPWQRRARQEVFHGAARFVLIVLGRRAGKTTFCADASGRNALTLHRSDNLWGAPTHALSQIGREKLHSMYGAAIRESSIQEPVDYFYGGGNVRWKSLGVESGSIGRGYGMVVVDEAARVKAQRIYEDVLPTVADTGGKIVAITTPRGRRNWTFDWYCKAIAGDRNYAVLRGPSTENPSPFVRDFVELARASMPDTLFRQEILGEFVEGEGAVFRKIREAVKREVYLAGPVSRDARYVIGCDIAKHQDYTVLYAIHRQTREIHGTDRFQHVEWPIQEDRIKLFASRWNNAPVFLDSTGVGDSTYDHLVAKAVPVVPVVLNNAVKANLVRGLSIALEAGAVGIVDDPVLISELESYAYDITPTGKFRYSAPEGLHDDCVMALCLALHGVDERQPGEEWNAWGDRMAAQRSQTAEGTAGWRPERI